MTFDTVGEGFMRKLCILSTLMVENVAGTTSV